MDDHEFDMIQYMPFINSAKRGADISDMAKRRRAEQVRMQNDTHATFQATAQITKQLKESSETSLKALAVAEKSLKVSSLTSWVGVATLIATLMALVVSIISLVKGIVSN